MHKVVINVCYGGYAISEEAINWLKEKYQIEDYHELARHDSRLVECVETLKEKADTIYSSLIVININCDRYRIVEYDGKEWIETPDDLDWVHFDE